MIKNWANQHRHLFPRCRYGCTSRPWRWGAAFGGFGRRTFGTMVVALVFVFGALGRRAHGAGAPAPKTSIPQIASVAGIQVGYSSTAELEQRLGPGKVMVGGHPNSARVWRVKGTSWVIATDAFDYSERGVVVDSLSLAVDPSPAPDVPYARVSKRDLVWLGKISLGMKEERLLQSLKQSGCAPAKVGNGWEVIAKGYSPLTSVPLEPIQQWTVRLSINEKSLFGLQFDARH